MLPRLFIAISAPTPVITFYDRANLPDAGLIPNGAVDPGMDAPVALAGDSANLFVIANGTTSMTQTVKRFANPATVTATSTPAVAIPGNVLPLSGVADARLDPLGNLWFGTSPGRVKLLANAAAATAATGPTAEFTHPFEQILGFAFEPTGRRLYGAQVSGAGMLVWNSADSRAGDAGMHDFVLATMPNAQTLTIGQDRLFSSFFTSTIGVWNQVSTLSAPHAVDFTMRVDGGSGTSPSIRHHGVFNGTLVVTVQVNSTTGAVFLFPNAASLSASSVPAVIVSGPTLGANMKRSILGADGTLYVLDGNSVSVFGQALTSPTLHADRATPNISTIHLLE